MCTRHVIYTQFQHINILICLLDEFRSKVACENEIVQLSCNPYSRIAIYSASYGRTEYESIQCAQPQGVLEESKFYANTNNNNNNKSEFAKTFKSVSSRKYKIFFFYKQYFK